MVTGSTESGLIIPGGITFSKEGKFVAMCREVQKPAPIYVPVAMSAEGARRLHFHVSQIATTHRLTVAHMCVNCTLEIEKIAPNEYKVRLVETEEIEIFKRFEVRRETISALDGNTVYPEDGWGIYSFGVQQMTISALEFNITTFSPHPVEPEWCPSHDTTKERYKAAEKFVKHAINSCDAAPVKISKNNVSPKDDETHYVRNEWEKLLEQLRQESPIKQSISL